MCIFNIAGNNKGDRCKDYAQKLYMKYTQLEARQLYYLSIQIVFSNILRKFLNNRLS